MANAFQYIANVGKSVGYSAIDTFKEMNPALSDFADQNGELGKILYESVSKAVCSIRNCDAICADWSYEINADYQKRGKKS